MKLEWNTNIPSPIISQKPITGRFELQLVRLVLKLPEMSTEQSAVAMVSPSNSYNNFLTGGYIKL